MSDDDDKDVQAANPAASESDDRLESWKEIATYFERGVTTVQRWEREEGLPVRRHQHAARGSVFACRAELDAWRASRERALADEVPEPDRDRPQDEAGMERAEERSEHATARPRRLLFGAVLGLLVASSAGAVLFGWSSRSRESAVPPPARPLADAVERQTHASLSPDGSEVVYTSSVPPESGLFSMPVAGGTPQRLVGILPGHVKGGGAYAAWSRRGQYVAFLREVRPWAYDLYAVGVLDRKEQRLASVRGNSISWMPDDAALAVADRHPEEDPFSIFLFSARTGERLGRLTTPPAGSFGDIWGAVSPDGRELAVARCTVANQADLHIQPIGGQAVRRITWDAQRIEGLDWSPDGRFIVFGSHRSGEARLWQVPADGSGPPVLVPGTEWGARYPSFSRPLPGMPPRLAYHHEPFDLGVWRLDIGSSAPRAVTVEPHWEDQPALSGDGRRLAFVSSRSGGAEIWTADGEGRQATRVTVLQGARPVSPRFSPDATRIAFASVHRGQHDVFVANADGSFLRRLTTGPWEDSNASWSADGRFIYFRSNRGGLNQIWRMPSEGGTATLITRGEASQARESSDGRTVYFVRGAITPGLWSVPVSGGPETFVAKDVQEGSWDLTDKGVFFLPRNADPGAPQPVRVLDLKTHRIRDIASLGGVRAIWPGFGASRDGRSIVWARQDRGVAEVMLLDSWVPAANSSGSQVADK